MAVVHGFHERKVGKIQRFGPKCDEYTLVLKGAPPAKNNVAVKYSSVTPRFEDNDDDCFVKPCHGQVCTCFKKNGGVDHGLYLLNSGPFTGYIANGKCDFVRGTVCFAVYGGEAEVRVKVGNFVKAGDATGRLITCAPCFKLSTSSEQQDVGNHSVCKMALGEEPGNDLAPSDTASKPSSDAEHEQHALRDADTHSADCAEHAGEKSSPNDTIPSPRQETPDDEIDASSSEDSPGILFGIVLWLSKVRGAYTVSKVELKNK